MKRRRFDLGQVIIISSAVAMFTFMFHGDLKVLTDFLRVNVWMSYSSFILIDMFLAMIIPLASIWIKFLMEERRDRLLKLELDYGVYKSAHMMFKREASCGRCA